MSSQTIAEWPRNAVMRSVVAMSGTPMCVSRIPLATTSAGTAATIKPPQLRTIISNDSRAIANA